MQQRLLLTCEQKIGRYLGSGNEGQKMSGCHPGMQTQLDKRQTHFGLGRGHANITSTEG